MLAFRMTDLRRKLTELRLNNDEIAIAATHFVIQMEENKLEGLEHFGEDRRIICNRYFCGRRK